MENAGAVIVAPDKTIALGEMNSMTPRNYAEAKAMAVDLAKSEIIPKDYQNKPANCLIAIMMGAEVGLRPVQALQGIMVVNGRPSIWGDAAVGLIQGSGLVEWSKDSWDAKTGTASYTTKRKGQPEITRTFSLDDAKNAGLLNKQGPWQGYKPRMCFNRARAFALRDAYADVLRGLSIYEEMRDAIDTTATVEPVAPPIPKAAAFPPEEQAPPSSPGPRPGGEGTPEIFLVEKVTSYDRKGQAVYRVWIGGLSYETTDKATAEAAKKWSEEKTPVDFTAEKTLLVEIHAVE